MHPNITLNHYQETEPMSETTTTNHAIPLDQQEMDERTHEQTMQAVTGLLEEHGVKMDVVFVPWSQSRNKAEKTPSLNWRVTIISRGRFVLTTDYSAGYGHSPSYKKLNYLKLSVDEYNSIKNECETGKTSARLGTVKPILPDIVDVIHSLLLDSQAIDYQDIEQWAGDMGYDNDSRNAETIYKQCVKIGLAMRACLGDELIDKLRELLKNY